MTVEIRDPEKYGSAALEKALVELEAAVEGARNSTLNRVGMPLFCLVAAGVLDDGQVRSALAETAQRIGLSAREIEATLASAHKAGMASPADVRIVDGGGGGLRALPDFHFTVWPGINRPNDGKRHQLPWDEMVERLESPTVDPSLPKDDVPAWNCAHFKANRRSKDSFERSFALMLDYDHVEDMTAAKIRQAFGRWPLVAHTSWSHGPAMPKWRIVLPLSRPVSAAEYGRLWDWAQTLLPGADQSAREAYWGWYVPAPRPGYEFVSCRGQGRPLDVDRALQAPLHVASRSVVVNGRQLLDVIMDTWAAIHESNHGPRLFVRADALTRMRADREDEDAPPVLQSMGLDETFGLLLRSARWVKLKAGEGDGAPKELDATPPKDVARDVLAYPDSALPPIETVVGAPVFGPDGALTEAPGYHRRARLWHHVRAGFDVPPVPAKPSAADVSAARALLLDDLLCDFPFAEDSDRAHALAALLLPFVRRMIVGPTPLHAVSAPTPGSGKGLIASVIGIIATGAVPEAKVLPPDETDVRKMLISEMLRGQPVILLDNADERRETNSPALAAALTADVFSDRILGVSEMGAAPNRALWILTGNNPRLSLDLARRAVRVRILPSTDRPWEKPREDFKHHPLRDWASANRSALVHACLTMVRAWQAAGRPLGERDLGSFEAWARVLGGILAVCGVEGFLADMDEFYEEADTKGADLRSFVAVWDEEVGGARRSCGELVTLANDRGMLGGTIGDGTPRSQATKMGRLLGSLKGRVFAGRAIYTGKDRRTKAAYYYLGAPGGKAEPAQLTMVAPPERTEAHPWWD